MLAHCDVTGASMCVVPVGCAGPSLLCRSSWYDTQVRHFIDDNEVLRKSDRCKTILLDDAR